MPGFIFTCGEAVRSYRTVRVANVIVFGEGPAACSYSTKLRLHWFPLGVRDPSPCVVYSSAPFGFINSFREGWPLWCNGYTPNSQAGGPGLESRCRLTKVWSPNTPISRLQVAKMCQGSVPERDVFTRKPSTRDDKKIITSGWDPYQSSQFSPT